MAPSPASSRRCRQQNLTVLRAFVTAIAVALSFTKSSAASFSTDSATYAVTGLPFSSAATINGQYAGYIPAPTSTDSAAQLFYWYLPSTNATSQELVIWLNGGPGCSSLIGLFEENGPVLFQNDSTIAENKYSWNAVASMLYVDQPVGAGFSTGDTVQSTADEVVATFLSFLDNFYKVFPALKSYNLYITGESFAGFFVPNIAYGLVKFEGTLNFWPDLFVADAAGGPLKRLSMPSVTTTVTSRINHQYQINDRLDILEISSSYVVQANVSADGVKELRILWSLIPQGDGPPYLCQMDVFEVLINAVEYVPNGNGAENSAAASASTLSVGAIVGIVLAGVVAVALSALLLVRRHNVKKRETNALPIGDKVLVQSS